MGKLRKLPYGANYLDWRDMTELKDAIDHRILFRYQTIQESYSNRLEALARDRFASPHALAVHNCTEALRLAILSTRPRVGDVVYIPAVTFVAVAGAVLSCGLLPVLVDVDERFGLDATKLPKDAERVVVAHMDGNVADLPTGVPWVVEDAAQAMGARHSDGRLAGTVGFAGAFSFHHNKVLTSGEGGLLLTQDSERWDLMRRYHDHGCYRVQGEYPRWQDNTFYGENCVTSEPIAAIQIQQFRHLDSIQAGLERGYALLESEVRSGPSFRAHPRKKGDAKVSLHVEFESANLRDKAEEILRAEGLPHWTLERYFLADHPVISKRGSIYEDGFPWNLAKQEAPTRAMFQSTYDRVRRTVCLSVAPEVTEAEQVADAQAFSRALRSL